jgi:lysozyme
MAKFTRTRIAVAFLSLSAAGFVGITNTEGYREVAYIPAPGDRPTLGFGTTDGVKMGDTTTPTKAIDRALRDIVKFEGALKKCVTVPMHQYEYDAYIDFSYNVGSANFCGSTMVKKLNAGDYEGACNEFPKWKFYQGRDCTLPENKHICGGLPIRREKERTACLGETS